MSETVTEFPEITVTGRVYDQPPAPPAKAPTPRQRARTKANLPPKAEPPPEPLPEPVTPGPELEVPTGTVLQPRAGILLTVTREDDSKESKRADGLLIGFSVTNNRNFSADTFSADLILNEDDPDFGLKFWSDTKRVEVEVYVGYGTDSQPSKAIIAGRIDEVALRAARRTVSVSGRDYTADLIELRLSEKWPNLSSSEIVRTIAGRVGLEADVQETQERAGTYYGAEHVQLADETNAWNLITYLAEREGFDAWVQGRTIHFKPPPNEASASRWTLLYERSTGNTPAPRAPAIDFTLTKSLTVSRDIDVKVISWRSGKKRPVEGNFRSMKQSRAGGRRFGSAPDYVFRYPNLTQEQANDLARQRAIEITKDLRSFDADLPGMADVDIRTIVTIKGTNTSFDTRYHLDEVRRSMSETDGFRMALRGRNVQPDDTAAL